MRPFFIVVLAPILQLFLRVGKAQEPVSIEAFRAQAAVKRFDERIVGRFLRRERTRRLRF
jgi:hypothetical protein